MIAACVEWSAPRSTVARRCRPETDATFASRKRLPSVTCNIVKWYCLSINKIGRVPYLTVWLQVGSFASVIAMSAFVALPSASSLERTQSLRGSFNQASAQPAGTSASTYATVTGVAALGAMAAAGQRRKHRSTLTKGCNSTARMHKPRSLSMAKVIVCAGATLA